MKLNPTQIRTLKLILTGSDYREIAERLKLSEHGISMRLQRIMMKTGASNRYELFAQVIEHPEWLGVPCCQRCGKIRTQLAEIVKGECIDFHAIR